MNKLKELREKHGFTKADIAKFLGITPEGVAYLEKSNVIRSDKAMILSKVYSVSVDEIVRASMELIEK